MSEERAVELEPEVMRVEANGLMHRVLAWGDPAARVILLAHGYLDHAHSFQFVGERLAARGMRAIAFDWRGHGETEWIGAGGYYHFADYVLDLAELSGALAPDGFDLLGHSMGGTACAMFAGIRPRGLRSLILCEGTGPPDMADTAADRLASFVRTVGEHRRREGSRPIRDLDEAVRRLRATHADLDEATARFVARRGTRPEGEALAWRFDPLHRTTSPHPFSAAAFKSLLARIEVPTLVVTGSKGWTPPDHAERVSAIPGAEHVELEGVGHMMHWLAPDALASAVLAHVSTVPGGSPRT